MKPEQFVRTVLNDLLSDKNIQTIGFQNLPRTRPDIVAVIEFYASDYVLDNFVGVDFNALLTEDLIRDYNDVLTLKIPVLTEAV